MTVLFIVELLGLLQSTCLFISSTVFTVFMYSISLSLYLFISFFLSLFLSSFFSFLIYCTTVLLSPVPGVYFLISHVTHSNYLLTDCPSSFLHLLSFVPSPPPTHLTSLLSLLFYFAWDRVSIHSSIHHVTPEPLGCPAKLQVEHPCLLLGVRWSAASV